MIVVDHPDVVEVVQSFFSNFMSIHVLDLGPMEKNSVCMKIFCPFRGCWGFYLRTPQASPCVKVCRCKSVQRFELGACPRLKKTTNQLTNQPARKEKSRINVIGLFDA